MSKYKNYEELLSAYADPKSKMTKAMFLAEVAKLQGESKEETAKTPTVEEQLVVLKDAFFKLAISCMTVRSYAREDDSYVLYTGAFALDGYDKYEDSNISMADVTADVFYPAVIHDELRGSFYGCSRFELKDGGLVEVIKEEAYSAEDDEQTFIELLNKVYNCCVKKPIQYIESFGSGKMIYASQSGAICVWFDKAFIDAVLKFRRKYMSLREELYRGSTCNGCTHAKHPITEDAITEYGVEKPQRRVVGVCLRRL